VFRIRRLTRFVDRGRSDGKRFARTIEAKVLQVGDEVMRVVVRLCRTETRTSPAIEITGLSTLVVDGKFRRATKVRLRQVSRIAELLDG
jgi:hypothetical protein